MAADPSTIRLPLPKKWPRRIRSAVIHTISLARTSLTHARSVAANSINARIRLKEEIDRLQNEISLLREESQIKDAPWSRSLLSGGRTTRPSSGSRSSNSALPVDGR